MRILKIEPCRECGAKREVPVTCRDCTALLIRCRYGRTGRRLCWRFQKRPGVEMVKEQKDGME